MKTSSLLTVLGVAVLLQQASGFAEPALRLESCDQDSACAELAQRAHQFSKNNQFADALAAYQAAAQLSPDPKLLFNIARILHKIGRFADAVEHYRRYLQAGAEGNQVQREKTEEYLAQAQRGLPVPSTPRQDARALPSSPAYDESLARREAVQRPAPASSPPQTPALPKDLQPSGQSWALPVSPPLNPLSKGCSGARRSRKLLIGGWTLIGLGGAMVTAAIVSTVLSTLSGTCRQPDGSPAQLCYPPPSSPPNLWPIAGVGYGLGTLSIGSGIGLLAGSRKESKREASQGGSTCQH